MMCLGIPGLVLDLPVDDVPYAWTDVSGARRRVNVSLLTEEGVEVGDWVLIHVGFALARLDEDEAHRALAMLAGMEATYIDELEALARSAEASPASAPSATG